MDEMYWKKWQGYLLTINFSSMLFLTSIFKMPVCFVIFNFGPIEFPIANN